MAQQLTTRSSQGGTMAQRREHPLQRLQRDFDTLFGRLWQGWLTPMDQDPDALRLWDFNVKEDDKEVTVRAELPGFEENEIDVQVNQDVLTVKAEKEQKGDGREEYRSFFRAVTLPPGVDAAKAQATYRNGVLEMHIPRAAGAQPKRIQVQGQPNGGPQGKAAQGGAGTQRQSAGSQAAAADTGKK